MGPLWRSQRSGWEYRPNFSSPTYPRQRRSRESANMAPTSLWAGIVMPTPLMHARHSSSRPRRCRCTPSIRWRPCWGRLRSGSSSSGRFPNWTLCLSRSAAANWLQEIAAWYAGRIKVFGVEPQAAPTLSRALAAGRPVDAEAGGIAAIRLHPVASATRSSRLCAAMLQALCSSPTTRSARRNVHFGRPSVSSPSRAGRRRSGHWH